MKRVVFVMALCFIWILTGGFSVKESVREEKMPAAQTQQVIQPVKKELADSRIVWQEIGMTGYAYSTLKDAQKQQLYLEIYQAAKEPAKPAQLSCHEQDVIKQVFQCVMADHPEFFYMDGYRIRVYRSAGRITRVEMEISVTVETDRISELNRQIEEKALQWIAGMPEGADDYQKIKYLYENVIIHTEYDTKATNRQNLQSVFITGRSVCQGYARALQYLCLHSGIECVSVTGTAKDEKHAWIIAKLDGDWYHVDPTWGDAVYQLAQEESFLADALPEINYDYLCVPDKQIEATHRLSDTIVWPVCDSVENQYYRREGLFAESADLDQIRRILENARLQGKDCITFQCADDKVYREVYAALIEQQQIFKLIPCSRVSYWDSRENRTLTFWVTD